MLQYHRLAMKNNSGVRWCPECQGRVRWDGTERCCERCGLVVDEDPLDRGPEWRSFDDGPSTRRRTGAPLTRSRHDRGLSTEIGWVPASRLTGRKRRQLGRLKREHNRAQVGSKADGNLITGFSEIRRLVDVYELPMDVREAACELFERAQDDALLTGRSIEGFAAATVYATCRIREIPRTIDEIVADARANESELRVAYDALNRELGLPTGPIEPALFLPRYASELGLPWSVVQQATEYCSRLAAAGTVAGRNPSGVAAGCLYAAARELEVTCTQTDAAAVADVAARTVRATAQDVERLSAGSTDNPQSERSPG